MMLGFQTDIADGTARVTLDRAERHNAFDDRLIAGLTEVFLDLDADPHVDTLVLAARGTSFSAGGDLEWMQRAARQDRDANLADAMALARLMHTLDTLSKQTLALVQGPAYGGGVGLVACCDIAIAADTAVFALSEVRLGLIPAAIGPYVVAAIGARQARRYFQTAETFGAAEARRIGLVHEVVAADALEAKGAAVVATLQGSAPQARKAAKRLVRDVAGRPVDDDLIAMTARRIADIRADDEAKEGLAAFFERRPPNWWKRENTR